MSYQSMETVIRGIMAEKKLTPAEKKKREEIATAIERENPDMPMDQKMAIATAQAKKVAEEVELEEAVTVNKKDHSWGKMVTVRHGNSHSYPLHPEHQEKIAKLKHDEKTSFKDETGNHVTAHRDGDTIHLSGKGTSKTTPVARSHFAEEVELEEDMKSAAKEMHDYASKHGGIDKADFHKAAKHMEAGDHKALHKHVNDLDTEPRDKILMTLHKHGNDIKRYGYTAEEVELDEATPTAKQVKQGIGIARDKRYAAGNMTGAVKTMDKINKGLAQHPAVAKELQKQNEEVDTGGAEEVEMATRQLHFVKYAADEIIDYIEMVGDLDEWFQNKLNNAFTMIRGLHSYVEGDKRMKGMDMDSLEKDDDEDEMEESLSIEELDAIFESTAAYGKSMEKQADDKKKAAMTDSDKQKLGAIANLMAKERMKKEEVELDELDKKTLGSYINKAAKDSASKAYRSAMDASSINPDQRKSSGDSFIKSTKRQKGIETATKKLAKEDVEEAVGTAAKYADKQGFMGGKYQSHDHMMTMKNMSKVRDDRAKKRDDEHKAQDPKMQKMGYAKHMLDTQKAKKKAAEKGVEYKTQRSNYHNTNGITPNRKLPEDIERKADVKMIKVKTADGKVTWKRQKNEVDIERDSE